MQGLGPARARDLPSVHPVLSSATASALLERFGRAASTKSVRAVLDDTRSALRRGEPSILNAEDVALQALLRRTGNINPVGTRCSISPALLHTNLGRAVLAEAAVAATLSPVAPEFCLSAGKRGARRRRSLCGRGRNPDAVILADCVRRRKRGPLRGRADRQRGLRPSSGARLRCNTDPRRSRRGY